MRNIIYILTIFLTCCQSQDNKDIILQFKQAEINNESLNKYLSKELTVTFSNVDEKMNYNDFRKNYEFTQEYQPWNEVISLQELNDSTIQANVLEYSRLLHLFEMDTVGYQYTYIIRGNRIKSINMDTIAGSNFKYAQTDSLFQKRLASLMEWMALHYPENYEKIEEMSNQSARTILEMAEEKYGR